MPWPLRSSYALFRQIPPTSGGPAGTGRIGQRPQDPVLVTSTPPERESTFVSRRTSRRGQSETGCATGLYHVDEQEVRDLAGRAGLRILQISFDERVSNWPYAVLQRAD